MMTISTRWACLRATLLVAVAASHVSAAEKLPAWGVVEAAVAEHLATLPDYRNGDLLSQSQVAPIFTALEARGWAVAERARILDSVLPDDDFLVQELRTSSGVKFMRKIAAYPQAFDEIDQLSQLPGGGQLMVKDFLRFANSDRTFINKRGPSPAMYARLVPIERRQGAPTPADLEKPTGRIYTATQLVARLKQSYLAANATAAQR